MSGDNMGLFDLSGTRAKITKNIKECESGLFTLEGTQERQKAKKVNVQVFIEIPDVSYQDNGNMLQCLRYRGTRQAYRMIEDLKSKGFTPTGANEMAKEHGGVLSRKYDKIVFFRKVY